MTDEFILWGRAFSNAEVGFQVGYDLDTNGDGLRDRYWWITLNDPPEETGDAMISNIPNCRYVYWVDFTIPEVLPQHLKRKPRQILSILTASLGVVTMELPPFLG